MIKGQGDGPATGCGLFGVWCKSEVEHGRLIVSNSTGIDSPS
jgi:hypothetical protein